MFLNKNLWVTKGEDFLKNDNSQKVNENKLERESLIQFEIDILSKYIEHPTKPGYKRGDIANRIKELNKLIKIQ